MSELYEYDSRIREEYPLICGVDEAGRGPLCGPVCCAAVILKSDFICDDINDSKKLSEKKREKLYDLIIENCIAYSVQFVSPQQIDEMNILGATMYGMTNAVKDLSTAPDIILIDGNRVPDALKEKGRYVIKGDATSMSIAAASILAKVSRDRYMLELDRQYPEYMLAKHKGYPTKLHYDKLYEFGVRSFYRKSFLKNREGLVWIED